MSPWWPQYWRYVEWTNEKEQESLGYETEFDINQIYLRGIIKCNRSWGLRLWFVLVVLIVSRGTNFILKGIINEMTFEEMIIPTQSE